MYLRLLHNGIYVQVWSRDRMSAGWRWGAKRDDHKKLHPALLPYSSLSEGDKQWDKDSARQTLSVIRVLGYMIQRDANARRQRSSRPRGVEAALSPAITSSSAAVAGASSSAQAVSGAGDASEEDEAGESSDPASYVPSPIDTSSVVLSRDISSLVELLAKNTHDVSCQLPALPWLVLFPLQLWCAGLGGRKKEGWLALCPCSGSLIDCSGGVS